VARAYLRLTDHEFWTSEPKKIFAMTEEWEEIEKYRAMICALANNGKDLPERHGKKNLKNKYVNAIAF
jgi:hypothetical protein